MESSKSSQNNIVKTHVLPKAIGLVAGGGNLPLTIIRAAQEQGTYVVAICFSHLTSRAVAKHANRAYYMTPSSLSRIIDICKMENIKHILLAGVVEHRYIYRLNADARGNKVLEGIRDRRADSILKGLASELETEGIHMLDSTVFTPFLLPEKGLLTTRLPTAKEKEELEFGRGIAKQIARLDIGQTIVVKNRAIVAVEAMEGTDATLKRAGRITRGGLVVIKVAKPHQDMRFDIPTVGPKTIKIMSRFGARLLAIESGRTLVLDKDKVIRLANRLHVSVVAL